MANQRILASEEMVGHGHGVKADTLNRQMMVEHLEDGTHTGPVCRIKTGTYTGDGTEGQAIAGVGFRPKYIKIWIHITAEVTHNIYEKLDQTWGDYCVRHEAGGGHDNLDNRINSLDADGFTVDDDGNDEQPNNNTQVYDYLALG